MSSAEKNRLIQLESSGTASKNESFIQSDIVSVITPSRKSIKTCYVVIHSSIICIGMLQFGYIVASWGNLIDTFTALFGWSDDEQLYWCDIV